MEIQTLNPATPRQRQRIEAFLKRNGLRIDDMNYYAAVLDDDGEMIAGGGLKDDVIKCVAVDDAHKGEAIANTLVSHLISHANQEGYGCIKLFTKPKNRQLFESLSFRLLAKAPEAVLMETGIGGISNTVEALKKIKEESEKYKEYNKECKEDNKECKEDSKECKEEEKTNLNTTTPQHLNTSYLNTSTPHHLTTTMQPTGCIVMNCNPFTLGHRYLIEQAAKQVERLYVMVVREDCSLFAYTERKAMVEQGVADIENVSVIDGSDYAISRATFPTYFLKRLDDAADTQMLLDLDLFRRHIAPALGATVRFVGTEPTDQLTRRYNQLMHEVLKDVREINRLEKDGNAVSASRVRKAMEEGDMNTIRQLVPPTTLPYIIAHLATQALQAELDTTPKPGLVDKDNNGAHRDMDYALMQLSINTLHPYFVRLAFLGFADTLPSHTVIRDAGIEAEKAMLEATNGVNTHKGALFSMGLAVVAAAYEEKKAAANKEERGKEERKEERGKEREKEEREDSLVSPESLAPLESLASPLSSLQLTIKALAASFPDTSGTHGSKVKQLSNGTTTIKGALDNAREGYEKLFAEWLPFYNERRKSHDAHALHKTLLRIMCDLDDTNVIYRTNVATAEEVKQEARALLASFEEAYAAEDKEKCASAIEEKCASAELLALKDMDRRYTERNISPGGAADMLSLTVFIGSIQTY
ncbi:MAG: triphosphoribosyl-dephospho-CoA synthase [Prevotella sp.]|uniref:GNAT family N-acetyltransferase n=1 Tax=Leyella stercorea TaxID=363265 RepID=UPI00280275C1|nr:triphosphoribosyl-dephospho-CoA synthase [Leyella stercorea]MDY4197398.1 triphosphoribosyl-dephospho-CoA synthase [Prevotella sp.]